ncbi:snRNA-activating protein complex subunit 4-like isoform X2 [Maniola jurtina]|uniref:snRNA-activating protein complex subunit 4-like isoform X2 n=1 Tax=Maniola jurtina TaxID=191418 RepID=UPI001E68C48C|nr:snRNA-activating protein complex subunit 4-like isoform X2 [Maniola jurtina]
MSDENSEFSSEESEDLENSTAITEIDIEEHKPGTSAFVSHEASTPVATSSHGENAKLSKIETALICNRILDVKLRKLEELLQTRLLECRRRLTEVQGGQVPEANASEPRKRKFTYAIFGKPYFKDRRGFPAPDNEDTILMNKSEMFNFSNTCSAPGWTVKDKCEVSKLIHKMSKEIKKEQLSSQILSLQRENKRLKSTKNNRKISILKKELVGVNRESLQTLALPIDEEYDWHHIANQMNSRHTANEYRALWKLFLHPSINKNTWSKSEHVSLQKIASEKELQDWDAIAQELGTGRTSYQCFVYFRTNMNNNFTKRTWTKEEENHLLLLIQYHREGNYIPWGKVAASMENRTNIQVYNKYARLLESRKGKFLPEEDSVILTCVNKFGPKYRKITEYLQGRSITQVRERHHLLTKRQYSTVWTIEEDRRLVRLLANQDGSTNFSNVSQYFPGKDRVHVRTRYTTLCRWMRRNPNVDLKHAPRRGPRRLEQGRSTDDLNKAIENLKKRVEEDALEGRKEAKDIIIKKKSQISKDSPEDDIDEAIVALITKEEARKIDARNLQASQEGQEKDSVIDEENKSCNITVLRNILILLKAKLNKQKFKDSPLCNTYKGLLDCKPGQNTVRISTYSRKDSFKKTVMAEKVDIWGNTLKKPLSCVLPPHYATITGCKQLMKHFVSPEAEMKDSKHMNFFIKNVKVKEEIDLLMERFNSLFLWPMLLSSVSPEDCKMTNAEETIVPSTSKSAGQNVVSDKPDYGLALPPPKYKQNRNIEYETIIDLKASKPADKINIDESYFVDHFMP